MENTSDHKAQKQTDNASVVSQSRMSATALEAQLDQIDTGTISMDKAKILYLLGKIYQKREEYNSAEEYLEQALDMYNELREQFTESEGPTAPGESPTHSYIQALNQLGMVYLAQNKLDYAKSSFEQALEELKSNENNSELALTSYHLGLLHQAQGDDAQALGQFLNAQEVLVALEKRDGVFGPVHYQIGRIFWTQKKYQEASTALNLALTADTKAPTFREVANIFYYLGLVAQAQTEHVKALEYLEGALEIYSEHAEGQIDADRARTLFHLGAVYAEQGQYDFAESFFEQSKEAYGSSPQNAEVGEILHQIGVFHQTRHKYELAIKEINQGLMAFRTFNEDNKYTAQINMLETLLNQLSTAIATREEEQSNSLVQTTTSNHTQPGASESKAGSPSVALQVQKGSTTEETGNNHLSNGSNAHSATTSHPSSPQSETDEDSTWTYWLSCCGLFKTQQSTSPTATPTHGVTGNPLIEPLNNGGVKGMKMGGGTAE